MAKEHFPHWFRQYRTASASYQISLIPPKDSSAATQWTQTFGDKCFADQWQTGCGLTHQQNTKPLNKVSLRKYETPPPIFDMKNTSLTRYKIDEWIVSRQFHTEHISRVFERKRGNPQKKKRNKMSKQKPALDKRKQQLVTCIQLATKLKRSKDGYKNPNKRNVYSMESAYQIEFGRREARSRVFQSNSREIEPVKHEEDRAGDLWRHLLFRSVLFIRVQHWCTSIL